MNRFPRMYCDIIIINIESTSWCEQYLREISIKYLLAEDRYLK